MGRDIELVEHKNKRKIWLHREHFFISDSHSLEYFERYSKEDILHLLTNLLENKGHRQEKYWICKAINFVNQFDDESLFQFDDMLLFSDEEYQDEPDDPDFYNKFEKEIMLPQNKQAEEMKNGKLWTIKKNY